MDTRARCRPRRQDGRLALPAAVDVGRRQGLRRPGAVHRWRRRGRRGARLSPRSQRLLRRAKSADPWRLDDGDLRGAKAFHRQLALGRRALLLRTGKRMAKRASEVAIQFREVPHILFNAHPDVPLEPTVLSLRVQPEEGLALGIASKLPGPRVRIYPVKLEFNYSAGFGETTPEAYERLLLDVMAGDATLFMRRDAVEAAWQFVMPILEAWQESHARFLPEYRAGTWGPLEADRLIERDGREWRTL